MGKGVVSQSKKFADEEQTSLDADESSGAERERVVSVQARGTRPERRAGALVERVSVRIGAISLEVRIELDTRRGARRRRVVRTRAAVRRVSYRKVWL